MIIFGKMEQAESKKEIKLGGIVLKQEEEEEEEKGCFAV